LNVAGRVVSKVNLVASGLGVGDGEAVATARSYAAGAITTQEAATLDRLLGAGSPSASRSAAAVRLRGRGARTGRPASHQA
jgi:hypothetical protein